MSNNLYNDLKVSPEDFSALPRSRKDAIMYHNIISIKKNLEDNKEKDAKFQSMTKFNNKIHFIWLFLLTTAVGLQKFIPFMSVLLMIPLIH